MANHQKQARARRLARQRERRAQASYRSPSPILSAAGGPRTEDSPSYEFNSRYRSPFSKTGYVLYSREMDWEDGEGVHLHGRGRRGKIHVINGRSDKTGAVSSGRTLRPDPQGQGGALAGDAISQMFPGEPEPLKEHQFPPKSGFAAAQRSMARPGYRAVGV